MSEELKVMERAKVAAGKKAETARVARLGQEVVDVPLRAGMTVSDVVMASGVAAERCEVKLNGKVAKPDTVVRSGDIIAVVPKLEGGI